MQTVQDTTSPTILERREARLTASVAAKAVAWRRLIQTVRPDDILLPLMAAAFWALTHTFQGIYGDANIYVGHALSQLDPSGVGRDMMFVDDGQMGFSLFPAMLKPIVAAMGTQATIRLFALLSMLCWTAALSLFARCFISWRAVPVAVIFVAVLPSFYGWPWLFNYAEITTIPRPFAEALVLLAMAALLGGRTRLSLAALLAGSLVHPLVALAGWGAFACVVCYEDRRWRIAACAAVVIFLAAAIVGLPVAKRLLVPMAPDLKALALARGPLLFVKSWPLGSLYAMAVQAATLIIAASYQTGRRRTLFVAVIAVAIAGLVLQSVFGDHLGLVLVIQAQLWRMTWLMAALGAFALALLALRLMQADAGEHIVLAVLAMAWLSYDATWTGVVFAAAAVAIHFGLRKSDIMTWRLARIFWACAILWCLAWLIPYLVGYVPFAVGVPTGGPGSFGYLLSRRYIAFPICALGLGLYFARPSRWLWAGEAALTLALVVFAICVWDQRSAFQKLIDQNDHPPALVDALASRPGEVLWVNGLTESWFLTGRPQWASPQQGVSSIFSPPLARKWRERMAFLIAHDLADRHILAATRDISPAASLPRVTRQGLDALCARTDAPAWVIAPNWGPSAIEPDLKATIWSPKVPSYVMTREPEGYVWHRISGYAIFPCAQAR